MGAYPLPSSLPMGLDFAAEAVDVLGESRSSVEIGWE